MRRHREEARKDAERQERARQHAEAERRRKVEDARRKDLEARAEAWGRAEAVRRFVAEVESQAQTESGCMPEEIRKWIACLLAGGHPLPQLARHHDRIKAVGQDVAEREGQGIRPGGMPGDEAEVEPGDPPCAEPSTLQAGELAYVGLVQPA